MRGRIIGWPSLLGVTGMAMLVGMWNLAAVRLPGEEVPDSIAGMLRGGDCYATVFEETCLTVKDKYCDADSKVECKAQTVYFFTGIYSKGQAPDGDAVCCGAGSPAVCGGMSPKKKNCGSTN